MPEPLRSVLAVLWSTRLTAVVPWAAAYLVSLVAVVACFVVIDGTGRYGAVPLLIAVLLAVWLLGATAASRALGDHYRRRLLGRGPIRFRTALARTGLLAAGFVLGWVCFIVPALYLVARYGPVLLVTEEGEDVRSSFARTARATEGRRWAVLGWAVVGVLLAASGFYVLAVGAVLTVPIGLAVTTCAWTALLADRLAIPDRDAAIGDAGHVAP